MMKRQDRFADCESTLSFHLHILSEFCSEIERQFECRNIVLKDDYWCVLGNIANYLLPNVSNRTSQTRK